uniref:Uncharacterized protein n=1 Tax=Sphaerodactylus townsendi TaxID=933632 RepID=A0ACB8E7U5_9SAUR
MLMLIVQKAVSRDCVPDSCPNRERDPKAQEKLQEKDIARPWGATGSNRQTSSMDQGSSQTGAAAWAPKAAEWQKRPGREAKPCPGTARPSARSPGPQQGALSRPRSPTEASALLDQ